MPKQKWVADETHGGWLIYDEENPDDTAAHINVRGKGAQSLAARVARLLNDAAVPNPQPDGGYPGCDACTCPAGFCQQNA